MNFSETVHALAVRLVDHDVGVNTGENHGSVALTLIARHRGHTHIIRSTIHNPVDIEKDVETANDALLDSLGAQIRDDYGH